MSYMRSLLIIVCTYLVITTTQAQETNKWMDSLNFAYLDTTLSRAICEVRYAGDHNFIGMPITGYNSERLVMTRPAAQALKKVEQKLFKLGYGLKVFDTYRPQRAVDHFISWSKIPSDTLTKTEFYPQQDKSKLFGLGYISTRSGHSRGSTIDLTIYNLDDGSDVDMGGAYDYFGELSHHGYQGITKSQKANREILKSTMSEGGFRAYSKEWWHYTLRGEPYPKTFFDHVVN